ncbi:MAG: Serine/threonine-protein kinase PknA, partial [uncultured Quadrisphaera sp.]
GEDRAGRGAGRALPPGLGHRRRRHGPGLAGPGRAARPDRRRQGAQARAGLRPRVPRPVPHRGPAQRGAEPPHHRHRLRLRRGRRQRLPGDGAGAGRAALRPAGPRGGAARAPRRLPGRRLGPRARGRPPRRPGAPRRQARQPARHPRRRREDHRLRHRPGRGRGADHRDRRGDGHRRLLRPRAG